MTKLRVLIADDSLFMRKAIRRLLEGECCVVVGEARDGREAVELVRALRPDVCTMDVNMPRMDGIAALREIMSACPTPVVMLSANTTEGARHTLEALAAGAIDFIAKPSGEVSADIAAIGAALMEKLRVAASSRPRPAPPSLAPASSPTGLGTGRDQIAIIVLSTGGPALLGEILAHLTASSRPAVVVQHMPAGYTATLAQRLDGIGAVRVREARGGERPAPGLWLIAPGDRHLAFHIDGTIRLEDGPLLHGVRPAGDITLSSAAQVYGRRALGLLMTGMGSDGVEGLRAMRASGGATFAQDRDSSLVFGMPRVAIEAGVVDRVVTLREIIALLM